MTEMDRPGLGWQRMEKMMYVVKKCLAVWYVCHLQNPDDQLRCIAQGARGQRGDHEGTLIEFPNA